MINLLAQVNYNGNYILFGINVFCNVYLLASQLFIPN